MADPDWILTARVTALPPAGMVTLKGDLADPRLAAVLEAEGYVVPGQRRIGTGRAGRAVWMAPDELLLLCAEGGDAALAAVLSEALAGLPHLAVATGDARVRFALDGPGAAVALAKLCAVDIAALGAEEVRRTRVGQIAAAFWRTEAGGFEILVARSVGGYAQRLLVTAARHVEGIALP